MGKIVNSYILPHPPIIVPEVGRGKELDAIHTIEAVKKVAKEIAKDKPTTIILSSPHAPSFRDFVYITDTEMLSGDLAGFGYPQVKLEFQNNTELATLIGEKAENIGIKGGSLSKKDKVRFRITDALDHGALVPLYFIEKELASFKLVHISTPFMTLIELYQFGESIAAAVNASDENVVYIASGDLSHRLTKDAPAGYDPRGCDYDAYLIDKLKNGDVEGLLKTEEGFIEAAGECGTRSFVMMLGALDEFKIKTDIYSYEGPFGVGYLVAKVNVQKEKGKNMDNDKKDDKSDYVMLAKESLEIYIKENKRIEVPQWVPSLLKENRAGVFVSIKKDGMLRGCIGTISPTKKNIAEEIMNNAISSGTEDLRFPAITKDEFSELVFSVDVLGEPEKIHSIEELDVKRYGVIVTSGWRRGLLLPDLEGVDTPLKQVEIVLQKAGIKSQEKYEMERFEVIRYY